MGITSDTSNALKDGAEDGEGRESGMKIDDKRKKPMVECGNCFEINEDLHMRVFVNRKFNDDDGYWNAVRLSDGAKVHVPDWDGFEPVSAKVVIE